MRKQQTMSKSSRQMTPKLSNNDVRIEHIDTGTFSCIILIIYHYFIIMVVYGTALNSGLENCFKKPRFLGSKNLGF